MDLDQLMSLPVAQRTDFLEGIAHTHGLLTAPGVRTESDVLSSILSSESALDGEQATRTQFAMYLKAPLTLIRLLQTFHPELVVASPEPLRILMLGATQDEVWDQGRWYSYAWELLGLPARKLRITAVGPGLRGLFHETRSEAHDVVASLHPAVRLAHGRLEGLLDSETNKLPDWMFDIDVCVMHHPGFVSHLADWVSDRAWFDLASFTQVPIIGTSFDVVDFEYDRHGVEIFGRTIDKVFWNPAAHVLPVNDSICPHWTRLQWGGVLWSTKPKPIEQIRTLGITAEQQAATAWMSRHSAVGLESMDFNRKLNEHLRWFYTCPMQFDDLREGLWVTDDIRIDRADGRVRAFDIELPATDLTRRLVSTESLEARLEVMRPLLDELAPRLDQVRIAGYMARHNQPESPGMKSIQDLQARFVEEVLPVVRPVLAELLGLDGGDEDEPIGAGSARAYMGMRFCPWEAFDPDEMFGFFTEEPVVPAIEGLERLTANVHVADLVDDEEDAGFQQGDVCLFEMVFAAEDFVAAKLYLMGVHQDALQQLDVVEVSDRMRDWFSRFMRDYDTLTELAVEGWNTGFAEVEEIGAVASVQAIQVAPVFRTDAFLAYVLEYARAVVCTAMEASEVDLTIEACGIADNGARRALTEMEGSWLEGVLGRVGATPAPMPDHGFDFSGEHQPQVCKEHKAMAFLPRYIEAKTQE